MFSNSSISKRALHALWLLGVLLLGMGRGWAQFVEQRQPRNNDPFVTFHTSLNRTADKLLATPIQRPARNGEITAIQIGKLWRFRASALNDWLEKIAS
jgi:hypothetical protein